jgi:hypothetical protein
MTATNRDWHRAFKAWLKGWTREIHEDFRLDSVWFRARLRNPITAVALADRERIAESNSPVQEK